MCHRPEIVDLAKFLNSIGAKISGAGTDTIVIKGVNELGGCCHRVIPDRIEAGTFMIAVAGTGGNVKIQDVIPEQLRPVIFKTKRGRMLKLKKMKLSYSMFRRIYSKHRY